MKNELQKIMHLSCTQYADKLLADQRLKAKENWLYDLHQMYFETEPLEILERMHYSTILKQYADIVLLYANFISHGSVYVYSVQDNMTFFLTRNETAVYLVVNYNPNEIDVLGISIAAEIFSKGIENGSYIISKSEPEINSLVKVYSYE
jgi:hypothetical protein